MTVLYLRAFCSTKGWQGASLSTRVTDEKQQIECEQGFYKPLWAGVNEAPLSCEQLLAIWNNVHKQYQCRQGQSTPKSLQRSLLKSQISWNESVCAEWLTERGKWNGFSRLERFPKVSVEDTHTGSVWVKVEASLNLFPKVQKGRNLYYINQSMWLINKWCCKSCKIYFQTL